MPPRGGPFVALDIDSQRLRIVLAEPGSPLPSIRKLAAIDVPGDVDMADPAAVGAFIGQSLRKLRLSGHRAAMDVPRSRALLKTVTLPPVPDERELPGMVRYQVEKELPYAISEAVIDFTIEKHVHVAQEVAGEDDSPAGGEAILVAAVRRSVLEYYRSIATAAELDLQQLGLRPYADVHCLRACAAAQVDAGDALLVHLTADEAEINILLDGALAFSRSATMAVAHDEQGKALSDSPVEGLIVEVVRSVQSVRAAQRGAELSRIFIAGGTGHESALAAALGKRLGAAAQVLSPVKQLRIHAPPAGEDSGFITALGLAIGHTGRGLPLDFLHPKEPPVERDMTKIRALYGSLAAAALLALLLAIGLSYRHAATSHLHGLEAQRDQLAEDLKPVQRMEKRITATEAWLAGDRKWLDHWANISAHMPPATEAYITSLKTTSEGGIVLTLKARGSGVITDAGRRLREAGYDVKLGAETATEDEYDYRYSNELRLSPRQAPPQVGALTAPPRPADDGSLDALREGARRGRS